MAAPSSSAESSAFSIEMCTHCKRVGAEFQLANRAFCHEDCYRASNAMPTIAKQIGTQLFDEPALRIGYDVNTGRGGVCAACLKKDIQYSVKISGVPIGVCSVACDNELRTELQQKKIAETRQIDTFLGRYGRHKGYEQPGLMAAAAWLFVQTRASPSAPLELPPNDGSDKSGLYRAPMQDIIRHMVPDVVAVAGYREIWHSQLYDAFALFCRQVVEKEYATSRVAAPDAQRAFQQFPNEEARRGALAFIEQAAAGMTAQGVAHVLGGMFMFYWRRLIYMRSDAAFAQLEAEREFERLNAEPHPPAAFNCEEHTIESDIWKTAKRLVTERHMPALEVHYLLRYGLFQDCGQYIGSSQPVIPMQAIIGQDVQQIADILDAVKRRYRRARDIGKPYSTDKFWRYVLEIYLLKFNETAERIPELKIDSIQARVADKLSANGSYELATAIQKEKAWNENKNGAQLLSEFLTAARGRLIEKAGGKERERKSDAEIQKLTTSKKYSTTIDRLRPQAYDDAFYDQIMSMAKYYYISKKPGEHKELVLRDIVGMYDSLRTKLGDQLTFQGISGFFRPLASTVTPGAIAAKGTAPTAAAPMFTQVPPPSAGAQTQYVNIPPPPPETTPPRRFGFDT
jgi:hypothetical protein